MSGCTVLIIDDDGEDAYFLKDSLSHCGVKTVHCVDCAEAALIYLEVAARASLPELIVTDHYMPRMTGYEFLKTIRSKEVYHQIQVVVLTTIVFPRELELYHQLGILEYTVKPNTYQHYLSLAERLKQSIAAIE